MDPSPPTRTYCLGYVRVSTHLQDISLEAQTEHITRAALYHNGGAGVDEFFEDADTSGSVPFAQREGGQRLLAAARQAVARGENVTVIVPKLDRLGRDTDDVRRTVTALDALGDPGDRTRIIFLDLNVDSRTPVGRLIITVVAACAEMELSRIRERVQSALDHKRSQNLVVGTVPFGWDARATGGTAKSGKPLRELVPNLDEQQWILHMARRLSAGASLRAVAQDLNRRGIATKRRGEKLILGTVRGACTERRALGLWTAGSVKKVLTNKATTALLAEQSL